MLQVVVEHGEEEPPGGELFRWKYRLYNDDTLAPSTDTCEESSHPLPKTSESTADFYLTLVTLEMARPDVMLCFTQVDDNKKLGEWVGLCKIDREGKPRKVVGCSCVVVKVR